MDISNWTKQKMRFSRFLVLFSVNTGLGMLPVVCLCYQIFELIGIFQSLFLEFQTDEKQFVEMLKMLQGLDATKQSYSDTPE